ncbi:MAG: hypothetical protein CMJ48_03145 [Planctomycetaceae bacterium]|nr:hypothetical protein [Planctomycetaceae bacterium]
MKISVRGWILIGAFSAIVVALAMSALPNANAQTAAPAKQGQLSEEDLGRMLKAMGLKPQKVESRYDFTFKSVHEGEDWALTMTAVLSKDGQSIWVMAWLDPLPRSAADVPRTALLRLLADNDRMGDGKFFAYVASNRRFVLQQVIPNQNMSTRRFGLLLRDLGKTTGDTYSHWSVANWNPSKTQTPATGAAPQQGAAAPTRSAVNDTKFTPKTRN